jgi:hypothetical protein
MEPWHHDDRATIYHGDCREVLRSLPDASVDSVVTDPPYELGFMGKRWDASGIAYDADLWAEALRVLKPGGHLLAFGGTRTWHRLAVAVEDAGFEVRDSIAWLYGSGFPKSLDVSKAIDKAAGAERQVVRVVPRTGKEAGTYGAMAGNNAETSPATPDAARWSGWGTALKPAFEPVVVARKPLTGTVAANVLEHGVGGLNIDGCRIGTEETLTRPERRGHGDSGGWASYRQEPGSYGTPVGMGRWPANVVLDEDQADALDRQVPNASVNKASHYKEAAEVNGYGGNIGNRHAGAVRTGYGDSGGASRFFYVAKAPARERPKVDGIAHPTVKPLTLMRWLCRLVTPPGGTVLEPFAGSGTTIEAALMEGFRIVAIEREDDYLPLIAARLERVAQEPDGQLTFDASA